MPHEVRHVLDGRNKRALDSILRSAAWGSIRFSDDEGAQEYRAVCWAVCDCVVPGGWGNRQGGVKTRAGEIQVGRGPAGKVKRKRVPSPGLDSHQIVPPWRSMIFLQVASPSPLPSRLRELPARKNGSKTRLQSASGMPMPLSAIENWT
jgi:hypothetical protein